jgi:nucleolar GTP-binding protein
MSFQTIMNVEKHDFYIDVAFGAATKKAASLKGKHSKLPREDIIRKVEMTKIGEVNRSIAAQLMAIIRSFPRIDELTPFYYEMIKCTLDIVVLKKSLAALDWTMRKTDDFTSHYLEIVQRTTNVEKMMEYRREYYGRISSLFKQMREIFVYLSEARRTIRGFPVIKLMPTVAICGFPNIGKTTLLSKLTASKPEIADYPFTTKQLNIGYGLMGKRNVQFIDTPGTLNRFDKMNYIERQAYLAAKFCADAIIYIFDLTEPYPLRDQFKLLENLCEMDKPVIVYLSKTDILPEDIVSDFKKDKEVISDLATLKKQIEKKLEKKLDEEIKPASKKKEEIDDENEFSESEESDLEDHESD